MSGSAKWKVLERRGGDFIAFHVIKGYFCSLIEADAESDSCSAGGLLTQPASKESRAHSEHKGTFASEWSFLYLFNRFLCKFCSWLFQSGSQEHMSKGLSIARSFVTLLSQIIQSSQSYYTIFTWVSELSTSPLWQCAFKLAHTPQKPDYHVHQINPHPWLEGIRLKEKLTYCTKKLT